LHAGDPPFWFVLAEGQLVMLHHHAVGLSVASNLKLCG
jgi:hypothetical protein